MRPASELVAEVRAALERVVPEQPCPDCSHDECFCASVEDDARTALAELEARLARAEEALEAIANPDGIVRAGDLTFKRIPPHEFARAALSGEAA